VTARRAFTLFESVLGVGLVSLLVLCLALLGPPLFRTWRRSSAQSEVQREVLLVLLKVRAELAQGYGPSLAFPRSGEFCFASRFDLHQSLQFSPEGPALWQKWVTFRHQPDGQLQLLCEPIAPPLPRLTVLHYTPNPAQLTTRRLARWVESFRATSAGPRQVLVEITCRQQSQRASLQSLVLALPEDSS
jgi:hypothetical protein